MLARVLGILGSAIASITVAAPLGFDPPLGPAGARVSAGVALKKAAVPPPSGPSPWGHVAPLLGTLVNVHSGECAALTAEEPSAEGLSTLLEDRSLGERVSFDPRLLETLRTLAGSIGSPTLRIELVSGYRSAKLNERLRKKGRHVASHSQHSLGHALDFRLGGEAPAEVRARLEKLGWSGGIGQYDSPTDRFVHLDVGKKRRWRGR